MGSPTTRVGVPEPNENGYRRSLSGETIVDQRRHTSLYIVSLLYCYAFILSTSFITVIFVCDFVG